MKKNNIKQILSSIFMTATSLCVCAFFFSCSDNDNGPGIHSPTVGNEIELARENHFYYISVPASGGWQVSSHPDWAGPIHETGTAGEQLLIFVEENGDDADRRDSVILTTGDNKEVCLPLWQHGVLSDDDNVTGEPGPITDLDLQLTYGTGYCIDVIKEGKKTIKYNVFNKSPFNFKPLYEALKEAGEEDALFEEPLHSSRYESITGSSTSAIANQLSVNAGIDAGISAFKLSVEGGYKKDVSSNDRYMYAMQEIQHIVGSRYLRAGMLRYFAQKKADVFQTEFIKYLNDLEADPTSTKAMASLINRYGTHIVTRGTLGGELKVSMQMKYTDESETSKIHAALDMSAKVIDVKGNLDMNNEERSIASNTTLSLRSYGGNNKYTIVPGTTFENFQKEVKNNVNMESWVSSIKDGTSLALIDIETIPIWDLMPTEELRDNLRNYVVGDYQKKNYGADFKPSLYEVTGYDVTSQYPGKGSAYLPEIDVQLDFERAVVPGLSESEYSTVVYSGPKGNVNRNRGFFVGSDTRKPCRFSRDSGGDITVVEEFERLDSKSIGTLYVDVTGDVTITPKGVTDLYTTTKVDWVDLPVDISTATDEINIVKSCALTGTTGQLVKIADGVTVTLAGINMTNSIQCQGNANIILKAGTKNVITINEGSYKNGLQNGPEGTTLTITSQTPKGYLSVRINSRDGTAIGGKAGNITITGGNIYAAGGIRAAGIGAGFTKRCGNIEISGGRVEAVGGEKSPGIGSGVASICGDITIRKTVEKVIAIRGSGTEGSSIGAGMAGQCGTITIEEGANVLQTQTHED